VKRALIAGVLLSAYAVVAAQSLVERERDDELATLRQEIEVHRAAASRLRRDEKGAAARLAEIEREMGLLAELLRGLNRRLILLEESSRAVEAELADAEELIARRQEQLGYHLRMLHRQRKRSQLESLLGARSIDHLAARVRAWTHVARTEHAMIAEVRAAQVVRGDARAELHSSMAEIELNRSEASTRQDELASLQSERDGELSRIRRLRKEHEEALAVKERSARELERLITRMEAEREADPTAKPPIDFATLRGSLPWPATGELVRGFGRNVHPRFKTVTEHNGISIAAAIGSPVYVVADGTVQYVNWLPGYGQCVIVNHGSGYYTFYAHTSTVLAAEGDTVTAGQLIAEVGDTGSLEGPQLYFELRDGKWPVDPLSWLATAAR
jgi:septal ring factor EnvC (AmiA/AmiB activator)